MPLLNPALESSHRMFRAKTPLTGAMLHRWMKNIKEGEAGIEDRPCSGRPSTATKRIFREDSRGVGFTNGANAWLVIKTMLF